MKNIVHKHVHLRVDPKVEDGLRTVPKIALLHNMKWTHINSAHVRQRYGDEFLLRCSCIVARCRGCYHLIDLCIRTWVFGHGGGFVGLSVLINSETFVATEKRIITITKMFANLLDCNKLKRCLDTRPSFMIFHSIIDTLIFLQIHSDFCLQGEHIFGPRINCYHQLWQSSGVADDENKCNQRSV